MRSSTSRRGAVPGVSGQRDPQPSGRAGNGQVRLPRPSIAKPTSGPRAGYGEGGRDGRDGQADALRAVVVRIECGPGLAKARLARRAGTASERPLRGRPNTPTCRRTSHSRMSSPRHSDVSHGCANMVYRWSERLPSPRAKSAGATHLSTTQPARKRNVTLRVYRLIGRPIAPILSAGVLSVNPLPASHGLLVAVTGRSRGAPEPSRNSSTSIQRSPSPDFG